MYIDINGYKGITVHWHMPIRLVIVVYIDMDGDTYSFILLHINMPGDKTKQDTCNLVMLNFT